VAFSSKESSCCRTYTRSAVVTATSTCAELHDRRGGEPSSIIVICKEPI